MTNQMMNIRKLRKEEGLTLKYVAKKIGISIPYLSQLEKGERRISYSDYIDILDILGYEVKIQKKEVVEEVKVNDKLNEMNNRLVSDEYRRYKNGRPNNLSDDAKVNSRKVIENLKEMDQDNSMLIRVLDYAVKYGDDKTRMEELFINNLPYLCKHDKMTLETFNKKVEEAINVFGNIEASNWTVEDHMKFEDFKTYHKEVANIGNKKRVELFNITEEENEYGDPLTIREYVLKNGKTVSVLYWLSENIVEYSYDIRTKEDGIYAIKDMNGLIHISGDKKIKVDNEDILNQFSSEDREDILRLAMDAYDYEKLFSAQEDVAYDLVEIVKSITAGMRLTKEGEVDMYSDEYKEAIKAFCIS